MVESATSFRKNGFNDEDAAQLARVSAMFQNVADETISAGDSAEFLISQLIAFNQTTGDVAGNATHIADSLNSVANAYAVGTGDLATGLKIVASTSSAMGNSLEETIGLLTAMTEQTKNASKSSRGLNTILANLAQVLDPASSNGEKILTIFTDLGVSMYDVNGQFRSGYELLSELADQWGTLDGNTQKYIATTLAGTNQLNNFLALMNNFGHAVDATNTALDSQGSAMRENAAYMESIQAKLSQLQSTFQDFANNIIGSDVAKGVLDIANALLQLANTPLGQVVTQILLLTGLGWGATSLANALKIFSIAHTQFANLIPLFKNLALAIAGAQGPMLAFAGAGSIALPIITAISAAIVGLIALSKTDWFKETFHEADYVNEKIDTLNAELETTKQKIEELKSQGASQNVIDLYSDKLDSLTRKIGEFNKKKLELSFGETVKTGSYDEAGNWNREYVNAIEYNIQKLGELKEAMNNATSTKQFEKLEQQYYDTVTALEEYYNVGKDANDAGVEFSQTEQELWVKLTEVLGTSEELAQAKAKLALSSANNTVWAARETQSLLGEANQIGVTKQQMADLIAQTIAFNNTELNVDNKIKALVELARQAGIASASIASINTGSAEYSNYINNALSEGLSLDEAQSQYVSYLWGKWNRSTITPETKTLTPTPTPTSPGTTKSQKQEKTAVEQANDAWKEQLSLLKDRLELMEKSGASDEAQIEQMRKIQDAIHKQAEVYRQLGLDENSEYLRELGILWWDYENDIEKIYDNIADKAKEAAEETRKAWQNTLEKQKSDYETAASAVLDKIDEEISKLQEQRDAEEQYWDDRIQALKDANSELEDQIKYEELLNNLAQAKNKQLYVFQNGQFQYVQDVEAISAAQAELDAYDRDRALDQEVANLEKSKKEALASIDAQIKGWKDYKDEWKDVVNQYTNQQNKLIAEQVLGATLEQQNWQTRIKNAQDFVKEYNNILANLETASTEGAVTAIGGSSKMSSSDLSALAQAGRDYNSAKTQAEKDAAHARAEAIRNKYGYSGGTDGSKYISTSGGSSSGKSSSSSKKSSSSKTTTSSSSSSSGRVSQDIGGRATHPERYAGGTLSAVGGLSMVGEQGPELRVLGQGDGILPADITRNLWNWGKINPGAMNKTTSQIFNISNLSLPNARDAESLITGLKQMAYQRAYKRA